MPIREATINDALEIALVQISSSQEAYKGILPTRQITDGLVKNRAIIWEEFLRSRETKIYIYEKTNTIIGFVHFGKCRDEDLKYNNLAEIWAIYVSPSYWRVGAGDQLMNKALEEIISKGINKISLWVLKENKPAIEFYRKKGFCPDGSIKIHDSGAEEIRMIKCI
jgi:ribosomal protein S18 acetylase RimI-like enzyme